MKRIDDETRAKIIDMYSHGKIHREIHEETGVSMGCISKICCAAGLDKYHVGGKVVKSIAIAPELDKPSVKKNSMLTVTSRTLKLSGSATGCEYTAGTDLPNVDIVLGDWALSIDIQKINGFVSELQQIMDMLHIA